jgi:DNA-binding transcriptional MerR regulator
MSSSKYSIGYTAKHVGLPQSVLRYWETVFEQLSPQKTAGGTRKYSDSDLEVILKIKQLLYERKFTIKGAQTYLNEEGKGALSVSEKDTDLYEYIIKELDSIIQELREKKDT